MHSDDPIQDASDHYEALGRLADAQNSAEEAMHRDFLKATEGDLNAEAHFAPLVRDFRREIERDPKTNRITFTPKRQPTVREVLQDAIETGDMMSKVQDMLIAAAHGEDVRFTCRELLNQMALRYAADNAGDE